MSGSRGLDGFSGSDGSPQTSAAANLIQGELHDWATEPFIHLGYTHPVVSQHHDDDAVAPFRELAKPLPNGRVMFAGEAYTGGGGEANMTVHSALDAGVRAAGEAAAYLRDSAGKAPDAGAAAAAPTAIGRARL